MALLRILINVANYLVKECSPNFESHMISFLRVLLYSTSNDYTTIGDINSFASFTCCNSGDVLNWQINFIRTFLYWIRWMNKKAEVIL